MNIFFDIDGTLWDSQDRLYSLFCDLVPKNTLSKVEYWSLKRAKITNEDILRKYFSYSEDDVKIFTSNWMSLIETPEYLRKDILFPFTINTLKDLNQCGYNIYYVTLRQFADRVLAEISEKGIDIYCKKCLVSEAKTSKETLVKNSGISLSESDIFVGDTGIDIMTGKVLGIRTVAVLSGFRNKQILTEYSPNIIINDISGLKSLLK